MADKMTKAELMRIINDSEAAELHDYIEDVNAYDIAELIPELDDQALWKLCSLLQDEDLAKVLEQASDDQTVRMAQSITNDELIDVFHYMEKDDITDLIGDLPVAQRKALMNQMLEGDRKVITQLLKYPEDSAGGIMTTAYISLNEDQTVSQAMVKIRQIANHTESIETVYVVDHSRKLVGTLSLRTVLTADRNEKLTDIMKENPMYVHPEDDQELCAQLVSKYDLNSLPVVNNRGSILGIITVDDVIDVIVQEYNEDILELAGVNKEETINTKLWDSVRMRLPWLLVNLATAFMASMVVKGFESTIEKVVALSASMTIISGMGGNAATQTQSILVRQLSQGEISTKKFAKAFFKEVLLGIVDGAACGVVAGAVLGIIYHNIWLGIIVVLAMIGNMVVAGVFGFLVPVVLKKLGADPAVSSSIFITTATDCLGFFIFLGLATLVLPLLE